MDWSLRSCSRRGHATYEPTDHPSLRERLHTTTAVGDAWRCLRCGDFAVGDPRGRGPADEGPDIAGGTAARDRVVLRLLAVERLLRAIVLLIAAGAVIRFRDHRDTARHAFDTELPLLRPLTRQLGWNIDDSKIIRLIESSFTVTATTLLWIGVAIGIYGLSQLVEAAGLWLMKRWGEYFAVVATSVFLPIEIYELTEEVTALRILLLAVNVAAVGWLVWSKRLFGAHGGAKAYREEHHANSLLAVERAAA